jgi:hypothetical protein
VTPAALIDQLGRLPGMIETAEADLQELEAAKRSLAFQIEGKEAGLLAAGQVEGRNAEERQARLRQETCSERQSLLVLEQRLAGAKRVLRYRENEFAAARALVRLLSGSEERQHRRPGKEKSGRAANRLSER